jgi:hypothetical protein
MKPALAVMAGLVQDRPGHDDEAMKANWVP